MSEVPKDGQKPEIQPFATFLMTQAAGRTHDELSEALHDVVAAVKDTRKKGTITLVVQIEMLDKKGDQIRISDAVRVKKPEHDRTSSIFWTDEHGNPTRNDPAMLDLAGLRVAEPSLPDVSHLREV